MNNIRLREIKRLMFVERTQNLQLAVEFARQGIRVYESNLKEPYGRAFKEELEVSIRVYREYLQEMQ